MSRLDETLLNLIRGKTFKGCDIGLELEMEGNIAFDDPPKYWTIHKEGSLKDGGCELVLREPLPIAKLQSALDSAAHALKPFKVKQSIRTSTHVHINMQEATPRQVYSVIMAWYLIEDMVIATQGTNRQGNLFCLGINNAEAILEFLLQDLYQGTIFRASGDQELRYAALNISAITKFKSLEFRFLKGMTDMAEVGRWVTWLHDFVRTAQRLTWENVAAMVGRDPVSVLRTLLAPALVDLVLAHTSERQRLDTFSDAADKVYTLFYELTANESRYVKHGTEDLTELDAARDDLYLRRPQRRRPRANAVAQFLHQLAGQPPIPEPEFDEVLE